MSTIEKLVKDSFGIALNANDFFWSATAATLILEPLDLEWALPMYEEYGDDGICAVMSFIAKLEPISHYRTEKFKEAYAKLKVLNPKVWSTF